MAFVGLLVLVAAHAADYATFVVMVLTHGITAEANPLVATIAREHGMALLTMAKVAAVLLMVCAVLIAARRRPRFAHVALAIGILTGSLGAVSNLATI